MTTLREAAQQALDALVSQFDGRADAINILSAALETQSTHSTDCYKWHHGCAIAEINRLRKEKANV